MTAGTHRVIGHIPGAGMNETIQGFLAECTGIVGAEALVTEPDALRQRYGGSTTGGTSAIGAAVAVTRAGQVSPLVAAAGRAGVALYPISAGRNWGYGAARPVTAGSVLLDLRGLKEIDDSAIDLGLVTLEPGVTQQELRAFLDARGHDFLVPVHGGGPNTSLVGNALERGYGITPYSDHFGAVTSIEAVLPDGALYRGPLTEQGAELADRCFKWGVGPYLEGLFSQGGFGVVTRMTIALAPRPSTMKAFLFRLPEDRHLESAVATVKGLLDDLPGVVGSVNLMNSRRVLSMMVPYPSGQLDEQGVIRDEHVAELARGRRVAPWTGFGTLYGEPGVARAAQRVVRRALRRVGARPLFLDAALMGRLQRIAAATPFVRGSALMDYLRTVNNSLEIVGGVPNEVALRLAYWKRGDAPAGDLDPARDHCGLIWFAPLVPMRPDTARAYVRMVDRVCRAHGVEPLITLTTLSGRCFDSTVPILFDAADEARVRSAHACYQALLAEGRRMGVAPYRYPVDHMSSLVDGSQSAWRLVETIKDAVDPKRILAPGRYARSGDR